MYRPTALIEFPEWSLRDRLLTAAAVAVLAALPVLLLMPLFAAPFERDQGVYGVIARGWLEGAIPYRDLWDNKGPVLFLWFAAAFGWFGENVIAPRLLAALVAGATVPFVWAAGVTLLGRRAALLAALLFATSFANLSLQANANAEVFMLLPLAAGFWAFAQGARGGRVWWFGLAGILTALAILTKQTAIWTLPGYGLWLMVLVLRNPSERRRHLAAGAFLASGMAVALLPFAGYFYYYGALYDFLLAVFGFNVAFVGQFPFVLKLIPRLLWHPFPLFGGAALWFLVMLGAVYLWRRGDRLAYLILLFLLFSELAAQSVGKNAPHYNVQLLPAAAMAGAMGLQVAVERWRAGRRRLGQVALACLAISVASSALVYAWPTPEDRFEAQYAFEDAITEYAERSVQAEEIAERVVTLTESGDYIYEFGRQSEIYFLADRQPATRWLHNRAYAVDEDVMDEILRDLGETRPALILLTFECGPFATEFPGCENGPPAKLKAYLDKHYTYAGRVHYADLYLRRPPDRATWTATEHEAAVMPIAGSPEESLGE
jgi:hypothetical protein